MDTLTASQELRRAGLSEEQADAIAKIARELGCSKNDRRSEFVTRSYLDVRIAKHTILIIALFALTVVLAFLFRP